MEKAVSRGILLEAYTCVVAEWGFIPVVIDLLTSMKQEYLANIKISTNKDTAKLTATAISALWWGAGMRCDIILEACVSNYLLDIAISLLFIYATP
ncbi:unnamed protein product [Didymodactylos carnosus]|uniref:Uncharacterized protein n=1 Tax=Didymodactylos carnosus TaxID=1234261 RepID=A0A813WJZ7_9BILA|nr:unnamed protein product [Didymodactylos carnosus]CAF3646625.1 unnamed protein product [Didymodactylos carnosus]